MIFVSESGLLDPARKAEWDAWYVEHLRIMLTVPGITSAQRLESATPGYPPSFAMYTVDSAEVFAGEYYLSIRGMGPWQPLIDPRHYRRNLFSGLDHAPAIGAREKLVVVDRAVPELHIPGFQVTWLECVGLDRSTPYRGLAVVEDSATPTVPESMGLYSPV